MCTEATVHMTGTFFVSSSFHFALCSSHLLLLHFNPPPVSSPGWRAVGRKAKRLPFERANPLHHISHNLLSFPITLWESISASSSHAAPLFSISAPLVFTSPVSYCCLAAFNPTHHPAVPYKLFVHASTLCNLGKRANPDSNEKRRKTQISQEIVFFLGINSIFTGTGTTRVSVSGGYFQGCVTSL